MRAAVAHSRRSIGVLLSARCRRDGFPEAQSLRRDLAYPRTPRGMLLKSCATPRRLCPPPLLRLSSSLALARASSSVLRSCTSSLSDSLWKRLPVRSPSASDRSDPMSRLYHPCVRSPACPAPENLWREPDSAPIHDLDEFERGQACPYTGAPIPTTRGRATPRQELRCSDCRRLSSWSERKSCSLATRRHR